MLGEDFSQQRQKFLGAIFLVAGNQHDVLPLAGPVEAVVNDPGIFGKGTADMPERGCGKDDESKLFSRKKV